MAHRSPKAGKSRFAKSRGCRRTRGGAGRHNLSRAAVDGPHVGIRVCLGCNRRFKSRGPWNRLCARCLERDTEPDNDRRYRVPREWPATRFRNSDDF